MHPSRRAFFADVGRGLIVAGLGAGLATDLGVNLAFADETSNELTFGDLEPLVRLLQDTEPNKLYGVKMTPARDAPTAKQYFGVED